MSAIETYDGVEGLRKNFKTIKILRLKVESVKFIG